MVFFLLSLLHFNQLAFCTSLHAHVAFFLFFISSSVLLFSSLVFAFGHLSLVRTLVEPGNNRQGRVLIGPQRIRACSREHSLEERLLEKQQVLAMAGY